MVTTSSTTVTSDDVTVSAADTSIKEDVGRALTSPDRALSYILSTCTDDEPSVSRSGWSGWSDKDLDAFLVGGSAAQTIELLFDAARKGVSLLPLDSVKFSMGEDKTSFT